MYSDIGYDNMEKVNEKCKEVAPEMFDKRLKYFQEELLLTVKNLCKLFTVNEETDWALKLLKNTSIEPELLYIYVIIQQSLINSCKFITYLFLLHGNAEIIKQQREDICKFEKKVC